MNLHNDVSSIDVVIHAEHAEWWQVVGALTPLATLVVLGFVVVITLRADRRQPHEAGPELRADWWSRAEWAMDMALDGRPEQRQVGLAVLDQLSADRPLADNLDTQIVAQAKALVNGK